MGLTLIAGPANAGKVARLLKGYLAQLDRDPVLIVPNRPDVERVERELLAQAPALFGGTIGTFDDLFSRLAREAPGRRTLATEAQRGLILRRAVASASLNGLGPSARFPGFVEALGASLSELTAGLVAPADVDGDLALLYRAYRNELDRLGLWDRELVRAEAVRRLTGDVTAWHAQPVFAYGFEDLTEAEWQLLEALAGRAEVTVSLPYEPGRVAFAALHDTVSDLARLADGRIEELGPAYAEVAHPALAYLERVLFDAGQDGDTPRLEGAVRFLEGAGLRGVLELVGDEILELVRAGTAPERIGVVVPTVERWRGTVETAFGALGIPYAVEARRRLTETPFGHSLVALLRYAWLGGDRDDLFAYLRSPFSGLGRSHVDFVEGRLRGRAVSTAERVEEVMHELRGADLPQLEALRSERSPVAAVRGLVASMVRSAFGLDAPPVGASAGGDLRAYDACARLLDELDAWERLAEPLGREDVAAALERATVRPGQSAEAGRVAVLDLTRARTRRFDVVFVLGLEEGSLPRRGQTSPFLDEEARRRLGGRLRRRDQVDYDRYLFYTACTRPSRRLYLVREAATDEGSPREPSPFWEEVGAAFPADEVARWTRRRPLSALTWAIDDAPNESACARWRLSPPPATVRLARWRPRTAGSAGSTAPASRSTAARGFAIRSCSSSCAHARPFP